MRYFRDTIPELMRATSFRGRGAGPRLSLPLAAALLAASALQASAAGRGVAVVGFGDYLWLRVDGKAVALEPGSPAYELPLAARAVVAQGAATLLAADALLRVDVGDDFIVTEVEGQLRLLVHGGAVEVSVPGRAPTLVQAGRFAALTGPEAGALPGTAVRPPPPPAPPVAVQPPPPAPPAAAPAAPAPAPAGKGEWDPLSALASGLNRLSTLRKPELRLVLELHPFYRLSETYDSNIYLVPRERAGQARVGGGVVGSWITVNELGTSWKLPLAKTHGLRGSYAARATNYSRQASANNALDQTIGVGWDYAGRRGVSGSVWDTYVNTEDPAFSELVARQRRMSNEVGGFLDVEHSRRLFTKLGARHVINKYLDPSLAASLNRYESAFGADLGVRVAPKTRVYAAYQRELVHYSAGRGDNSTAHRVGLGVSGQLSNRVSGRVQTDAHFRRYSGGKASLRRATTNVLASVNLVYKAGRRFEGRLGAWRNVQESAFGVNRYSLGTGASLGATQTFRKWSLNADGSFETSRYPETSGSAGVVGNRRDDTYIGSVRADYKLRTWLSTDLSYQRLQRHSFFADQFNYAADRTSFSLRVQF